MGKTLLCEKINQRSDLGFPEVEATLPEEQNVGILPSLTIDVSALEPLSWYPCPGSGPLLRAILWLQTGHDYTGVKP